MGGYTLLPCPGPVSENIRDGTVAEVGVIWIRVSPSRPRPGKLRGGLMDSRIFNKIVEEGNKQHGDNWMDGKSYKYMVKKIRSHLRKFMAGSDRDEGDKWDHLTKIEFYLYSLKLFKAYPWCDDRKKHA
jgi:hypothetical protein